MNFSLPFSNAFKVSFQLNDSGWLTNDQVNCFLFQQDTICLLFILSSKYNLLICLFAFFEILNAFNLLLCSILDHDIIQLIISKSKKCLTIIISLKFELEFFF